MRLREFLDVQIKDNNILHEWKKINGGINGIGQVYRSRENISGYSQLQGLTQAEGEEGFDNHKYGIIVNRDTPLSAILKWYYGKGPAGYTIPEGNDGMADSFLERLDVEEYPIEKFIVEDDQYFDKQMIDIINKVDKTKGPRTNLKELVDDFGNCVVEKINSWRTHGDYDVIIAMGSDKAGFFEIAKGPKPTGDVVDVMEVDRQAETMKFDCIDRFKQVVYDLVSWSKYKDHVNTVYHVAAIITWWASKGGAYHLPVPEFNII